MYGPDGMRRQKQEQWTPEGKLSFSILFDYDDAGRRSRMTWYNPDGAPIRSYRFCYDGKGNRTAVESTDSQGRMEWRNTSAFNEWGDCIRTASPSAITIFRHFKRDRYGNWMTMLSCAASLTRYGYILLLPRLSIHRTERKIFMHDEPAPAGKMTGPKEH
jgi:YD repeat-containing protein